MNRQRRRLGLALPLALLGCSPPRPLVVPMRRIALPLRSDRPAPLTIVMLPGAYSVPEDFVREGFVDVLRARHVQADLLLVDAHLGYFERGMLLERLMADVVDPLRAGGVRNLWFVGISLGGFAALAAALQRPGEVSGTLAIAPYLGRRELVQQIRAAGGVAAWRATQRDSADGEAMRWIELADATPARRAGLHLYSGRADRFAEDQRLWASMLPEANVSWADGDHDWPAWRTLWARWLERAPWPAGHVS